MPLARHKKYSINVECDISASPAAVFDALTRNTQRWDYLSIEMNDTDIGSLIVLRDEEGNATSEQLLAYQSDKLFARTELRYDGNGEQFPTQLYFYLTQTAGGTRVHIEQSGYDDMMLCEQDKQEWSGALARMKALCEHEQHDVNE